MRLNHGAIFWGLALITAGAVALAVQAGVLSREQIGEAWRLWPVILIALGVSLVASRTPFALLGVLLAAIIAGAAGGAALVGAWGGFGCIGDDRANRSFTRDGTLNGEPAEVALDLACGDLTVDLGEGSGWRLEALVNEDRDPRVEAGDTSLSIRDADDGPFGVGRSREAFDVTLPAGVLLDLRVETYAGAARLALAGGRFSALGIDLNAGGLDLDTSGADIDELAIDANAASVAITTDGGTALRGRVDINAGSIELCAPEGVSLAISRPDENPTFSDNLDESALQRSGDTWRSAGASSGAADIELTVDGNAGSFTLNPEDGCG
jgi:hypothetical protein